MHLFPHTTRLLHLSTENGRSQSVKDGHQRVYSRADTLFTVLENIFPKWVKEKYFLNWKNKKKYEKSKIHDFQ